MKKRSNALSLLIFFSFLLCVGKTSVLECLVWELLLYGSGSLVCKPLVVLKVKVSFIIKLRCYFRFLLCCYLHWKRKSSDGAVKIINFIKSRLLFVHLLNVLYDKMGNTHKAYWNMIIVSGRTLVWLSCKLTYLLIFTEHYL